MGKKRRFGMVDEYGNFYDIPNRVKYNGFVYHNPRGNICHEMGYYELITSDKPNDNKNYKDIYELRDNYIYQDWVEISQDTDVPEIDNTDGIEKDTQEIDIIELEKRVALLEQKVEFLMDFGKFKGHWEDFYKEHHKHDNEYNHHHNDN